MGQNKLEYKSGETPPEGNYVCMQCNGTNPTVYIVPEMTKKLPVCPVCGGKKWMKF